MHSSYKFYPIQENISKIFSFQLKKQSTLTQEGKRSPKATYLMSEKKQEDQLLERVCVVHRPLKLVQKKIIF